MSKDPDQEYFSDGLTETLTGDLSKISSLFVIARNSAFTYKGKAVKVQDVGREMGVRYVLEGSVQKADQQIRITTQLIEATTGYHLWSEQYDRPLKDIFALQDEIVRKIAFALKVKLTQEEQTRFRRAPTNNLEAYDFYLRGCESYYHYTKEGNIRARRMFERAIELDSQYAGAHVWLGWTYLLEWVLHWSLEPQQSLERAFEFAQKARILDDSLAAAHMLLSWVSMRKQQPEQAIAEAERAIALDPNYHDSYGVLADALSSVGRPEEAIEQAEKAIRLNPSYALWYWQLGQAYYLAGQVEEAIAAQKQSLIRDPNFQFAHVKLAWSYVFEWSWQLTRPQDTGASV